MSAEQSSYATQVEGSRTQMGYVRMGMNCKNLFWFSSWFMVKTWTELVCSLRNQIFSCFVAPETTFKGIASWAKPHLNWLPSASPPPNHLWLLDERQMTTLQCSPKVASTWWTQGTPPLVLATKWPLTWCPDKSSRESPEVTLVFSRNGKTMEFPVIPRETWHHFQAFLEVMSCCHQCFRAMFSADFLAVARLSLVTICSINATSTLGIFL